MHNQKYLLGISLKHLNRPNTSLNREKEYNKPLSISVQGGIEFDVNPYERSFLPRYSFLYTYASITQIEKKMFIDLVQEMRMGGFSVGLNQKLSNSGGFNFNSIGLGAGLQFENFEFGMAYNFPFRAQAQIHSPSVFEIFVTFDFSRFQRNQRGFFKFLQTENY